MNLLLLSTKLQYLVGNVSYQEDLTNQAHSPNSDAVVEAGIV
jgi:hypothetical protein